MSSIYVYHEKQVGSLCGKHCMNALLQGPYYTEVDLMRFAQELDEIERRVMAEKGTDTKEFLEYMRNDSENISDDGNFSIQVLTRALNSKGLEVFPYSRKMLDQSMHNIGAFLINQGKHWLAIRKVNGKWYNCNSMLPRPSFMSEFYLASYLEGLMNDNFDIYAVRGTFPQALPYKRAGTEDGQWIQMEGNEESDFKAALRASMEDSTTRGILEKVPEPEEIPLVDHRHKSVFQNPLDKSMLRKPSNSSASIPKVEDPFAKWLEDPVPETVNQPNHMQILMENMSAFASKLEAVDKKLSDLEKTWNVISTPRY